MANNEIDKQEVEKLVRLSQEGDTEAFSKIYDLYVEPIYRYVFYRVKSADAEDLVENIFLKVWEKIDKYKFDGKSYFSSWVFRIAHNVVIDYYRTYKPVDSDEAIINIADHRREHNPITAIEDNFDKKILMQAISKLKKPYQEVILYKFVSELSNAEVAGVLGKKEGSVRILQFRALNALRQELKNMGYVF